MENDYPRAYNVPELAPSDPLKDETKPAMYVSGDMEEELWVFKFESILPVAYFAVHYHRGASWPLPRRGNGSVTSAGEGYIYCTT